MLDFSKTLDDRLDSFEQKWRCSKSPPSILAFYNETKATFEREDQSTLAMELAMVDLELRWRRFFGGARSEAASNDVHECVPDLPQWSDYRRLFKLGPLSTAGICHEYRVRQLFGDRPSCRLFSKNYPELADNLSRDLPNLAAQLSRARIQVFCDNRPLLTTWLPGRSQIGRRRADEPTSPCRVDFGSTCRLIVAGDEARHLSRNQVGIEVVARDRVVVRNEAPDKGSVVIAPALRITETNSPEVTLPCRIHFSQWLLDIS